jgi:hypothetical protein
MTYKELQAMQVAYELLAPLDPKAQHRVMTWLSAALADTNDAPTATDQPAATTKPVAEVPAQVALGDNVAHVTAEHQATMPKEETAPPTGHVAEPATAAEPNVAVEPEPDPRPRRSRSTKVTSRRAAKTGRSAAAVKPVDAAPEPRRDRPDGEQFLADLAAVGSFKALAEKYSKSIGTIGNWANQLREQGFDIPVGRQKKA